MRLIDADEFDNLIYAEQMKYADDKGNYTYRILEAMRTDVRNRPTVDVAPVVHSRWIEPVPGDDFPYCGNCKAYALDKGLFLNPKLMDWHKTKYCPNCAAKMDLEE